MDLVLMVFFPTMFVFLCIMWMINLRFYHRNGWDFSKDSGFGKMYFGKRSEFSRIPNRIALFVGFPILLISFGYLSYEALMGAL